MVEFLQQLMPRIGDRIADRYRIERILGEGGFGVVYVARQENLDREVAIKMLLPTALADRTAVQRFQREVDLVRRLEHPNTVRIFDRGETPNGLHFYVMEYVKGRTVSDLIGSEGPLPPGRVWRIAEQVLMSLGEAHEKGIIHRDLKPSNIMLTEVFGRGDFVKVVDFGIGKLIVAGEGGVELTTQNIIGTPFYMSPEQVKSAPDIDGRSDLYALGLIIHEMLTARRAIDGPSPLEVVMLHARPEPVLIDPYVAEGPLGPIVIKATQKERSARFWSAGEMLEELQATPVPQETGRRTPLGSRRGGEPPVLTPPRVAPVTPLPVEPPTRKAPAAPEAPATSRGLVIGAVALLVVAGAVAFFAVNDGGRGSEELGALASPPALDAARRGGAGESDASQTATADAEASREDDAEAEARRRRDAIQVATSRAERAIGNGRRQGRMAADVIATSRLPAVDAGTVTDRDAGMAAAEEVAPEPAPEEPAEAITATIRGTPASARVRIGDETVCRRLPCEVTLPGGDQEVRARVSADGYDSTTIRLRREPGRSYNVELWRRYE